MRHEHACVSIAVVASLCSFVSVKGSQPLADVPFDLVQQHLIVAKGSVGPVHGLNLLIDTGTIPSVVDHRIAGKLRLRAEPSIFVAFGEGIQINSATLSGLRIGPLEPGDVSAGIGDLSYLQGTRIDAIIGLDVLARKCLSIDYKAHTLSFAPSNRESAQAPLTVVWPFLTVRLLVAGRPHAIARRHRAARDLVLFKSRMPSVLLPVPWKGEKVVHYASGPAHLRRFELRQVTLGDQRWDTLPGFVLDASTDAYPGHRRYPRRLALGGTRVRFDFERGKLSWSK